MASVIALGPVAHFSIAVREPRASARWWTSHFDLEEWKGSDERVLLGNDAFAFGLARGRPDPAVLGHLAFRLPDRAALENARDRLRAAGVDLEDPGDEIGPVAPGSSGIGLWFHDLDGYRWELYVAGTES